MCSYFTRCEINTKGEMPKVVSEDKFKLILEKKFSHSRLFHFSPFTSAISEGKNGSNLHFKKKKIRPQKVRKTKLKPDSLMNSRRGFLPLENTTTDVAGRNFNEIAYKSL